ncbi:RNA-dependent RNA polymerase [viral metagenome]|uniref:RNA-dependent RNA polymerase n=1 Tax=viral metagenome TaxID=1070528 RepID=A0A6L2ZJG1_9ZZZZ
MRKIKESIFGLANTPFSPVIRRWAEWCFTSIIPYKEVSWVPSFLITDPDSDSMVKIPLSVKPDAKVSFLLGRFPARVGERPTSSFTPKLSALVFSAFMNTYFHVLHNIRNSAICSGSFLTNWSYFQDMFLCSGVSSPPTEEEWKCIISLLHKKIKLPALEAPRLCSVGNLEIQPDTFPGARERYLLKLSNKLLSSKTDLWLMKKIWGIVASGDFSPTHIYSLGAREKREEEAIEGAVKTRGVIMPESWFQLFEGMYSRPIETWIFDAKVGSIYLGHSFCNWGWLRYFRDIHNSGMIFEGDFKGYDTTITEELMVRAFCVLRSCYPDSGRIDKHFIFLIKNFVFKNLLIPGGFLFRLNKGLPSGSSFTSLVGSIVNLLILCDLILNYPLFKRYNIDPNHIRFLVSGDDFLIVFNKGNKTQDKIFRLIGEQIDEANLNAWVLARHGVKIKKPVFKYADSTSKETLFGQIIREFHCGLKKGFNVPVFFFNRLGEHIKDFKYPPLNLVNGMKVVDNFVCKESLDFANREVINSLAKIGMRPSSDLGFEKPFSDSQSFMKDFDLAGGKIGCISNPFSFKPPEINLSYVGYTSDFGILSYSYMVASNQCASFLKTIIFRGLPSVSFSDLYLRIMCPSSNSKKSFDYLNFLRSMCVTSPSPDYHTLWAHLFFSFARSNLGFKDPEFISRYEEYCAFSNFNYRRLYFEDGDSNLFEKYQRGGKVFISDAVNFPQNFDKRKVKRVFCLNSSSCNVFLGKHIRFKFQASPNFKKLKDLGLNLSNFVSSSTF